MNLKHAEIWIMISVLSTGLLTLANKITKLWIFLVGEFELIELFHETIYGCFSTKMYLFGIRDLE